MKKAVFCGIFFLLLMGVPVNTYAKGVFDGCCEIESTLTSISSRHVQNQNFINTPPQLVNFAPNQSAGNRRLSFNWSGYQAYTAPTMQDCSVDMVKGSWKVPKVSETSDDTYSSAWVGIVGSDQSILQIGTRHNFINGEAEYVTWFEIYPYGPFPVDNLSVKPGDQISAKVKWLKNFNGKSLFLFIIANDTTGKKFKRKGAIDVAISQRSSAAWIVEAPTVNGEIVGLADYKEISFFNCKAVIQREKGSINSKKRKHNVIEMIVNDEKNQLISKPSRLDKNGSAFKVKRIVR